MSTTVDINAILNDTLTLDGTKTVLSPVEAARFKGVLDVVLKQQAALLANLQLQALQEADARAKVGVLNERIIALQAVGKQLQAEIATLKTPPEGGA